ncbi:MAG TPA: ATP-grasp domain-containing protein [Sedimentisphaerales bacterium]|nr:ATP-grasp domain-containing protein [Sedimentisphaerales bacterium]
MSRRLRITVLVDTAAIPGNDPEFTAAEHEPSTEYEVIGALRNLGYKASVLGAGGDIGTLVSSLKGQRPQIVFNLTEEFSGDRRLDKNIAGLLEMLGIPFTGTGPAGLMLCRDKLLCKQLLSLHRIRVPGFVSLAGNRVFRVPKTLRYPLVVKPEFEDGSEGISNASLVGNEAELKERVQFVHERWKQPVIAEEYVEGRELYVSILGNSRLVALPVRECIFDVNGEGPQIATYRVKWNKEYREKWNIKFGFAKLDAPIVKRIWRVCRKVYRLLQMHDYGRIDIRLAPDNKVIIIEANSNPDIAYGEEVAEAAEKAGISYEKLIDRILKLARRRYK